MKYRIKIEYTTGNSYGSHNEVDYVDVSCDTEAVAIENLRRLSAHHVFYKEYEPYQFGDKKKGAAVVSKHEAEPWFVGGEHPHYMVRLLAGDGSKMLDYHPPYHGYFEHLNALSIEIDSSAWRWEP